MATLDPGFITNPFPSMNDLMAPQQMALARQRLGMEQQQNGLMMQGERQSMDFAAQKNPLEIQMLRQQLGLDGSPGTARLNELYGQPAPSASPTPTAPASFEQKMGGSESGNDPTKVNHGGFSGQYQMGKARMADLGYYQPVPGEDMKSPDWPGKVTVPGFAVSNQADFLKNQAAQHVVFGAHVADIDRAIAATPGADKLDPNGLRAVAHLGGIQGMRDFIRTGGLYDPGDDPKAPGGGTHLSQYYAKFAAGGAPALQQAFGSPHGPAGPPGGPGGGVAGRIPGAVTVAGPGAPTGPAPGYGPDGQPLAAGTWDASPVTGAQAAPAPAAPGAAPGAVAPAAAPATGVNSPQVQQAQRYLQQATQIELEAAKYPNNPQVKGRAAAMVQDLRGRAQVLMTAGKVSVDPVTGIQTDQITGHQDAAAAPLANYQYDAQQGAYVDTTHTHAATFAPTGRIGKDAFGNTFVTGPGGRTQAIPAAGDRPLTGDYDQQSAAYKADIPVQKDIATAGRAAQATALQLNELADVIKGLNTGGIAPEFRAKAAALLEASGAQPETIKSLTGMSSGSDAQVMQKLAVATLGQAAKTDLGSNVGVESLNLYAQANPGMHLLEDANKRVTNMIRVARAQVDSYSVGAEQHFNTNQTSFLHQGRYDEPLSVYNQKWLQQNNPQIGMAAMGILNGDKYDAWAGRAQPAEAIEATRLAYRIDPNAKVPMPDGSFKPAREVLARAGAAR